jgi:hypothetical protein
MTANLLPPRPHPTDENTDDPARARERETVDIEAERVVEHTETVEAPKREETDPPTYEDE